jgi:hypothetical protein
MHKNAEWTGSPIEPIKHEDYKDNLKKRNFSIFSARRQPRQWEGDEPETIISAACNLFFS